MREQAKLQITAANTKCAVACEKLEASKTTVAELLENIKVQTATSQQFSPSPPDEKRADALNATADLCALSQRLDFSEVMEAFAVTVGILTSSSTSGTGSSCDDGKAILDDAGQSSLIHLAASLVAYHKDLWLCLPDDTARLLEFLLVEGDAGTCGVGSPTKNDDEKKKKGGGRKRRCRLRRLRRYSLGKPGVSARQLSFTPAHKTASRGISGKSWRVCVLGASRLMICGRLCSHVGRAARTNGGTGFPHPQIQGGVLQ